MKIVYLVRQPGIASRTPAGFDSAVVSAQPDGTYAGEDLAQISDADILVVGLEPVGEEIFERARRLRLVQRLGVGFSEIDLEAAARRGVPVCTMPDFNAATVGEHTIMLILALLRRLFESTLLMKAGRWPIGEIVSAGIYDLRGKTLGLIGFGAIGRAVAARALAFDVRVWYNDTAGLAVARGEEAGVCFVELDELLAESDIVSIHVPLNARTRDLLGRAEIWKMRRSALLINTASGAVVDEAALAEALEQGVIAGAGIDVFSEEPLDQRHPLRRCPNVVLTPHTAGQTREAMERMVAAMLENIQRVVRGEEPLYEVTQTEGAVGGGR